MYRRVRNAFTLVELVIVILIIGTLITLSSVQYIGSESVYKMHMFEANVNAIEKALSAYRSNNVVLDSDTSKYPLSLTELQFKSLFKKEPINPYTNKTMLNDNPNESGIRYTSDGSYYEICIVQKDVDDVNKNNSTNDPLPVSVAKVCGPLIITITEDTQTDFLNGELNSVTATNDILVLNQRTMLKFDGINDYVHVPQINNVKYGPRFTIEMLIRIDSITTTQTLFTISRTQAENRDQAVFSLVPANGGVKLNFWDYSKEKGKTYGFPQSFVSDIILLPGQIYHVAFVKDVMIGTFYVNGEPAGSMKARKNIHYDSNDVFLGFDNAENNYYYKGYMDEVRIWDIARTQNELQNNINNELTGNESGLTAYWKLNEHNGTVAYDSTDNNSDGTIHGAQWASTYPSSGIRISPIYSLGSTATVVSSKITWTANTPAGTSVTVETRISLDGGTTWSNWQQCTNGGAVPELSVGIDLSNARIQIRQTLTTNNPSVTPQLDKIVIQITPSK